MATRNSSSAVHTDSPPGATQAFRPDQPLFYVDQVGQINLGPFVSRVSFVTNLGTSSGDAPSSVVQIAIPTAGMYSMAKQILTLFSKEEVRELVRDNMEKFSSALVDENWKPKHQLERS